MSADVRADSRESRPAAASLHRMAATTTALPAQPDSDRHPDPDGLAGVTDDSDDGLGLRYEVSPDEDGDGDDD